MAERSAATAPCAPEVPAQLPAATIDDIVADGTLLEAELVGAALPDGHAGRISARTARLRTVDLAGARLTHLSALDVVVEGSNLANLEAVGASLVRVRFSGCRLTGVRLVESLLRDVHFVDCRIELGSFHASRLQQVTFEDCVLTQADLLDSVLTSVRFHDCALEGTDFRGARLYGCELRRSSLAGAHGIDRLAGLAMPWPDIVEQAGVWAGALGIEVLDADQDGR